MCGIVAAALSSPVQSYLLEGLTRLEYRGYDSAGIAVQSSTGLSRYRAVGTVDRLSELVPDTHTEVGIGHTRWATHGGVTLCNAHPHLSTSRVAVVHNGIIENYASLKANLEQAGYAFESETDTEVVAHLLDRELRRTDSPQAAFLATLAVLKGSYALAVLLSDEPHTVYVARNKSPLLVARGASGYFAASDVLAVSGYADEVAYLEDGVALRLTSQAAELLAGPAPQFKPIPQLEELTSLGDWPHYMLREIHEQPKVLRRQLQSGLDSLSASLFGPKALPVLQEIQQVLIVGAGTSYHAGLVAQYWIEAHADIPVRVELSSELRTRHIALPAHTLVVALSQSGETADTLEALRGLRRLRPGLPVLALCNVPTSSLVREADLYFPMQAGPEVSVASTKAFCAQIFAVYALAHALAQVKGREEPARLAQAALADLAERFDAGISWARIAAAKFAPALDHVESVFFLGRGDLYPLAMEAALKLKEVTYVHAEAFAAGELKHGPLAMMSADRPVICFVTDDELAPKVLSSVHEVEARGAPVLLCGPGTATEGTLRVALPEGNPLSQFIHVMLLGQLLAYECAIRRGLNPDRPRHLAKSVTVE